MRKPVRLFAFTFVVFFRLCQSADNKAIRDYDRKICTNEPSCHLLNETYLPKNRFSLRKRDCMCDEACAEYRDCCLDSPFYSIEEQSRPNKYYCSPSDKVYMKVTCPEDWSDQSIADECAQFLSPLTSINVSTHIPVTNPATNITYGNQFCALCNGDTDYESWTEIPSCGEVHPEFLAPDGNVRSDIRLSVDYVKYRLEAHEIWQNSVYDETSTFFVSRYKDKVFVCRMHRVLPKDLEGNVRYCVSNVIETCSDESSTEIAQKCSSYTSLVFQKSDQRKRYRNMDCAICNGVSQTDVNGCPITLKEQ